MFSKSYNIQTDPSVKKGDPPDVVSVIAWGHFR